jgi:multicomponent Na+:H+ antiporter subunit F
MTGLAVTLLIAGALVAAVLATVRIVAGPTNADRVVALDILLAAGVALSIAASLASGRTVFLDVAIGLALVGFVATIGWARLVERAPRTPPQATPPRPTPGGRR